MGWDAGLKVEMVLPGPSALQNTPGSRGAWLDWVRPKLPPRARLLWARPAGGLVDAAAAVPSPVVAAGTWRCLQNLFDLLRVRLRALRGGGGMWKRDWEWRERDLIKVLQTLDFS